MPMTTQLAREGYAFYSVSTPKVFREYELPMTGKFSAEAKRQYEELKDLAEIHKVNIVWTAYRLG